MYNEKGYEGIRKEIHQLDNRECFRPLKISEMTRSEKHKVQHAIAYLTEKCDGTIKGRTIFNSKPTREWL